MMWLFHFFNLLNSRFKCTLRIYIKETHWGSWRIWHGPTGSDGKSVGRRAPWHTDGEANLATRKWHSTPKRSSTPHSRHSNHSNWHPGHWHHQLSPANCYAKIAHPKCSGHADLVLGNKGAVSERQIEYSTPGTWIRVWRISRDSDSGLTNWSRTFDAEYSNIRRQKGGGCSAVPVFPAHRGFAGLFFIATLPLR